MLLKACVDTHTMKFYFCELFLTVLFLAWSDTFWEGIGGTDVPSRKAVLEETCLAWDLNWWAASALLGLVSLPSTSWRGLCQQSDWTPFWLGTSACGDCSWSLRGCGPNSAVSCTSGGPWGDFFAINDWGVAMHYLSLLVLGRLACDRIKSATSQVKVFLYNSLVEEGIWIQSVVGRWVCQAWRRKKK